MSAMKQDVTLSLHIPEARFRPGDHTQAFLMGGEWAPPRAGGYAIEVWAQADLPSRNAFGQTARPDPLSAIPANSA